MNASAPAAPPPSFHPRLILFAALLCLTCGSVLAQTPSSDYTTSLPSVDKVKAQLKGTDPIDTVARQVAVFTYLQTYIQRIKDGRKYGGPYTPGEQKLLAAYSLAGYQLSQDFTKTHTPDQVKAFQQLEGRYEINNALDWIKQLEGTQAADTYKGTEATLAASQKAFNEKIQQDMKQDSSSNSGGGGLLGGLPGGGGDGSLTPDQKRCLELGGTHNECASALMGAVSAMASLITLGASDASTNAPPPLSGVILVGFYHSRTDLPEIGLTWDGRAYLQKCGTLVD